MQQPTPKTATRDGDTCPHQWGPSCPYCIIDRLRVENLALQRAHDFAIGERNWAQRNVRILTRYNRAARRKLARLKVGQDQ